MLKEHNKITTGYVIQNYITLSNGSLVCVGQEFIAGDQVDYENDVSEPVTVDTDKEVYCPFEMIQPKPVPQDEDIKFVCPDCGSKRLECVMDETNDCEIIRIAKNGELEFGDAQTGEECTRFGCRECNFDVVDEDGQCITNDDELIEWLKKNCSQE